LARSRSRETTTCDMGRLLSAPARLPRSSQGLATCFRAPLSTERLR
jgi:hypothetical protein